MWNFHLELLLLDVRLIRQNRVVVSNLERVNGREKVPCTERLCRNWHLILNSRFFYQVILRLDETVEVLLAAKAELLFVLFLKFFARILLFYYEKLITQSALLRLYIVKLIKLLIDKHIKVNFIIILQNGYESIELLLKICLLQLMLSFQMREQIRIFEKYDLIQIPGELAVPYVRRRAQSEQNFLKKPLEQIVELIPSLGHVLVL